MQLSRVTIYGTGLIGGSLATALKRAFPKVRIAGVDKPEVLEEAKRRNIIDHAGPQPADLVILATQVSEILKLVQQFHSPDTVVTDVGSTKVVICNKAESLDTPFIGGHPMAGSQHAGLKYADPDLFKDRPYFLCRVKSTPNGALDLMRDIAKAVGATPYEISPEDHDRLVAQISHLPQILSTVLADQTFKNKDLGGGGLQDMTRLASSSFQVWRDIFKTSGFLPQELRSFIERLQRVHDSINEGNLDEIEKLFKSGGAE